ncbi:hypothetical protein [Cohnella nanjingensis]|uniref:Uncharacterized protein n=1 Tax=Cohnella nanjingensis TaxID=1387779 RepID=A0A7X0RKL7_9BACL|nr:hypothetical protein [Cohnella nanjingensis]MBB6669170.1 hypothetical protein [Cohnella nanjingensis]
MISSYDNRLKPSHPILAEARQIAPNQIIMTYDKRTDLASATNVSNYWIRSNVEQPIPPGMATEGMDWGLTELNAVRPDFARITPIDHSNMRFVMTFRFNAISGIMHVVLPCFVNLEGMTGFDGENWGPYSRNMFIGM